MSHGPIRVPACRPAPSETERARRRMTKAQKWRHRLNASGVQALQSSSRERTLGHFETIVASHRLFLAGGPEAQSHTTVWSSTGSRIHHGELPDSSNSSPGTLRIPHRGAVGKLAMGPRGSLDRHSDTLGNAHNTWLGRQRGEWGQGSSGDRERGLTKARTRRCPRSTAWPTPAPSGQFVSARCSGTQLAKVACCGWQAGKGTEAVWLLNC